MSGRKYSQIQLEEAKATAMENCSKAEQAEISASGLVAELEQAINISSADS